MCMMHHLVPDRSVGFSLTRTLEIALAAVGKPSVAWSMYARKLQQAQETPSTLQPSPTARLRPNRNAHQNIGLRPAIFLTALTLGGLVMGAMSERLFGSTLLASLGYAVAYMAGGLPAAREAVRTMVRERKLNIDLLMVLAALGAASIGQAADGAILLFLFSLSNTLQFWALGRTKNAIRALMKLNPEGATLLRDGAEHWIEIGAIQVGDTLLLKPGERIPADARLTRGSTAVDESPITGESRPVDKVVGNELSSGTVNLSGSVEAVVLRPAGESTLARLVALMEVAQTQKSRTESVAERLEGPYATTVLLGVPLIFSLLHLVGQVPADAAWYRAMTFMVVASPCAVLISTPAVMLSGMAAAARAGVLFKSSAALEALASVKTIAFDKTGTLTEGKMRLTQVVAEDIEDTLGLAAALERYSEHPIAQAVVKAAADKAFSNIPIGNVQAIAGHGISGELEGASLWAGNRRMAARQGAHLNAIQDTALGELERNGSSTVIIGRDATVLGLIGVADTPRSDAKLAVERLRALGIKHLVMLTGDKYEVAQGVAATLGISEFQAELLPEDKLRLMRELPSPLAMVGDGINDAPALASADLGIAVGSGTDVALESADLVLMQNDLGKLAAAVRLARDARRTVIFNLVFAFGIILIVAPLAVAGRVPLPLGVIAHEGGTVFVVLMGLRLLAHRIL